jgi:2-oxoglutarate dehydrogenase E2 component (dihydrolipoamide succinyltransferase)
MYELKIPNNLESIIEVKITKIYKSVGDSISIDEVFCEIETDKVSIEVTSQESGTIHSINIKEQDTVSKDKVLAIIDTQNSSLKKTNKSKNQPKIKNKESTRTNNCNNNNIKYSPQINTQQEVFFLNSFPKINIKDILQPILEESIYEAPLNSKIQELSTLKKTSIKNLKISQLIAASTTTYNEFILDNLINYRENTQKKDNQKISFNAFFLKAVSIALSEFPILNSQLHNQSIYTPNNHNLAIAISSNYGLVTPVIKEVETKSINEINEEIKTLAEKANNKLLTLKDLTEGTFTLTNGGIYGSMLSTPIINYPQSAILGLHKIQKKPIVITNNNKDNIEIASTMYVSLSYDHRIIDGKDSVSFLSMIKAIIENPQYYFKKKLTKKNI